MSSSVEDSGPVADRITAEQFDRAAIASGRTMAELADLIGVSRGMIHAYRNQGVTRPRTVEQVRRVMALWLRDEKDNPYEGYTDDDLVREVSRRLARIRTEIEHVMDSDSNDLEPDSHGDGNGRYTGAGGPPEDR